MSEDPLLSVNDVARLWGTGLTIVVDSIQLGDLPSLDRGLIVAEGRYDVPLIRRSWADALREPPAGAERAVDAPEGEAFHPGAMIAYEFHKALDLRNAQRVYVLSSAESRSGRTADELLDEWYSPHLFERNAGVGTTLWSLEPFPAVAARVFAEAPAMARALTDWTRAGFLDALPLIAESDAWRLDLPLYRRKAEWTHLLDSPLPGAADGSGDSGK
jgi:hypothetical protein